MYIKMLRCMHATTVAMEKQKVLHILRVCLQPLVSSKQCTCGIPSFLGSQALRHFPILSHKWQDFRNTLLNIKCVLIFSTNFV